MVGPHWSVKKSVGLLLAASAGIGLVAELLVASAHTVAQNLGWNEIFVGVILLAIIGNAAEHSTAVILAKNNDMDTAMTITYQSSLQIALFATPFLVLLSAAMVGMGMGKATHLDLIFTPMEVVAVITSVMIVVAVHLNGETNWFEGMLFLALYAILGIGFFYIPSGAGHG
jgi:Ca2+:H+ antiporter